MDDASHGNIPLIEYLESKGLLFTIEHLCNLTAETLCCEEEHEYWEKKTIKFNL